MLHFFEGFETVGTETGLVNQATTRPRIELRWDDTASGGIKSSDSFFLIDDAFGEGYAIQMGDNSFSNGNDLEWWVPDNAKDAPGTAFREWVIGFRVHIPNSPVETFDMVEIFGLFGGTNQTTVLFFSVTDSTDISIVRANPGQFTIVSVADVLTPGAWHYIEMKFKIAEAAFITRVEALTGTVTSGNYTLTVEVPSQSTGQFTTANIAYNANATTIAAAIDSAAPGGLPSNFVNVTDEGTQGVFDGYIELTADDDTEVIVEITNVSLVGGDVGTVSSAEGGFVEVRIDDTEVINEHQVDTNNALTTGFDRIAFQNAVVGSGGENYVGYDDIYILENSAEPHTDYLTPVRVRSLPPDGDVVRQWENDNVGNNPPNYTHVDENGADDSDYIETDVTGDRDRYTVTDPTEDDNVVAVKVEAEVINATGGSPSLFLEVASGTAVESSEFIIAATTAFELVDMYVQDDPAGGVWTSTAIDDLKAGVLFNNNVG